MTDERERFLRQLDSIMLNEDEQESRAERVLRIIEANCELVREDAAIASSYGLSTEEMRAIPINIRIKETP